MQGNVNIPDSTITTNLSFRQLVLMNMQQLTNFPYIEKDFDALTDYELLCLVVKFLNDVIANQNEQNDSITRMYQSFLALQDYVNNAKDELEDAFNNLDDYVRNYFDNLDVQEEINNKLDQMLEDGVLEQIIEQFLQSSSLWCFDNVSGMKQATNLINGSYAGTLGFYSVNDGGKALYKIRLKESEETPNEITTFSLYDTTLVAELIKDKIVSAKQIGCKTDGSDNSTILNSYFSNNSDGLYFPNGNYSVESEIDTIGNVIMDSNAWLVANDEIDCVIHINKNLVIPSGSFANNYPKNQEFKINVDGNKLANTGIRTDKLHWSKLVLTAKNCEVYGVHTRYNTSYGHAENTFDIQIMYDTTDGTNTSTGIYVGDSDDIYNNIVSINTKYGVEINGGDNSFGTIHCWLVNSELWSGSKMILISNQKNHISNLIVDTYETGIAFNNSFNVSTGVFNYTIDFMYGLINTSFIPAESRNSYKLWDFTGLTGAAKNNSSLIINSYIGNDQDTAKISLGGSGICPWNTKLIYGDDYTTPKWTYDLNYCPEGTFAFTGDTNVSNKPLNITAGNFVLKTSNSGLGKDQELIQVGLERQAGATVYNTSTIAPTSNFTFFYRRVVSKYNVGNNPWGQYASYYVQSNSVAS